MLLENKATLTKMLYSNVTGKLTFYYSDGNVIQYDNVPEELYKEISNNGRVVSNEINEKLQRYNKIQMV